MKKRNLLWSALLLSALLAFGLTACDINGEGSKNDTSSDTVSDTVAETVLDKYTVMFNLNGGTLQSGQIIQTIEEGQAAVAPTVTNGNKTLSWDTDFSNITQDTVVTAVWTNCSYTVTFDLNGGTLQSGELTQTVEDGMAATAPVAVNGNHLLSWDTDFSKITGDTTVTAVWTKQVLDDSEIFRLGKNSSVVVYASGNKSAGSQGSGFFIDGNGTIVTNFHVIDGAGTIEVKVGEATYPAQSVIAFSHKYDLAMIKINYQSSHYLTISDDEPQQGEKVYTFGTPHGHENTMTTGNLTEVDFSIGHIAFLKSNAKIEGGNSGGPLMNRYGEVIGINAYSYTQTDLHLAIKASELQHLEDQEPLTMNEWMKAYDELAGLSYKPAAIPEDDFVYYYSLINTYTTVTGTDCDECLSDAFDVYEGYHDAMLMYLYKYTNQDLSDYQNYLMEQNFDYEGEIEKGTAVKVRTYYHELYDDRVFLAYDVSSKQVVIVVTDSSVSMDYILFLFDILWDL